MDAQPDAAVEKSTSYTYWVRQTTCQAPVPRKLTADEMAVNSPQVHLGSAWNQAGTWEEKSLNTWAVARVKELLGELEPIEYGDGSAHITDVSCSGEATVVTVRNKKRVGFSLDITLKFEGSLLFEEYKDLQGKMNVHDACCGELDDLQIEVDYTKDEGLPEADKARLTKELKTYLPKIRDKLLSFEKELKER